MTFDGAAYSGLNVRDFIATNRSSLQYLQDHLRIVDPLYGWLRPMDAIEGYRLEMATRGLFEDTKQLKLEDYWKPGIAACLEYEETAETAAAAAAASSTTGVVAIVNLASDEYSSAVDHGTMVKIVFRHGGRTIAVHAKRARGLMVRYASLNTIETVDGLKAFDLEGYSYQPDQSTYDDMGGAKGFIDATITATAKDSTNDSTKGKKKKKKESPTLVFDRPATYKRPK